MILRINGVVGDWPNTHEALAMRLDEAGRGPHELFINSPGGDVAEGLGMYFELVTRDFDGLTTVIAGQAASMGSVLAMAGSRVKMARDALFMIHDPWVGAAGSAAELRQAADMLDKWGESLAGIYERKTKLPKDRITAMMAETTWLNAEEALELGFVDEIIEAREEKLAESRIPAAALAKRLTGRAQSGVPKMNELAKALQALLAKAGAERNAIAKRVATASGLAADKAEQALTGETPVTESTLRALAAILDGDYATLHAAAESAKMLEATPEPAPAKAGAAGQAQPATPAAAADAVKAELQRVRSVRALAVKAGMSADEADVVASETTTTAEAQARILNWRIERNERDVGGINGQNPSASVTREVTDKFRDAATSAIIHRAGKASLLQRAAASGGVYAERLKLADPGEFRGWRMANLARHYLEIRGQRTHGMSDDDLMRQALGFGVQGAASITQSTDDFSMLLQDALHKILLAAYDTTPDTWSQWCGIGSVTDFRPHYRYRMGFFNRLDPVQQNGEFRNQSVPDAEREIQQASTVGNIINLSRQALVNDDLSAFDRLAGLLGRAARLSVEIDALAVLTDSTAVLSDGKVIFHADHDNLASDGGVPTVQRLADAADLMGEQMDPEGNEILDLQPAVFLGPRGLARDAQVINEAQFSPEAANSSTPNKSRGLFRNVVGTSRMSGTAWYVFADPAVAPAVEVAFLNGVQEPYMEMREGFRADGVEWKVRLDYGVAPVDYRPAVRNAGA